jgi:hypothetical protein
LCWFVDVMTFSRLMCCVVDGLICCLFDVFICCVLMCWWLCCCVAVLMCCCFNVLMYSCWWCEDVLLLLSDLRTHKSEKCIHFLMSFCLQPEHENRRRRRWWWSALRIGVTCKVVVFITF